MYSCMNVRPDPLLCVSMLIAQGAPQIAAHHQAMLRVGGSEALIDALVEVVSGIVDEKAVAAAHQYIAAVRKQQSRLPSSHV